jgi:hypothetical protein
MSPSKWFGVISVVASGIITRNGRTGFKWRKGNVATFSEDRGSQWRSQVIVRRLGFKPENGVHYFGKQDVGVQMQ